MDDYIIFLILVFTVITGTILITAFSIYDVHRKTEYCTDNGYEGYDSTKQVCYKYIQKQNDIGYEIKYSGIIRGIEDE